MAEQPYEIQEQATIALADSLHGLPFDEATTWAYKREWAESILDRLEARGFRVVPTSCPTCHHSWSSHGPAGVSQGCYAKSCTCRDPRPPAEELAGVAPSNVGGTDG